LAVADGWQATTVVNRARKAVRRIAHVLEMLTNPFVLGADITALVQELSEAPAGDPDAVLTAANRYADAARSADAVGTSLKAIAGAKLPAVAVGVAAGNVTQAVTALAQGAAGAAEGARTAEEGLRRYAGHLRDARAEHAKGKSKLADGLGDLARSIDTGPLGLTTSLLDLPGVVRRVREALETIHDGAKECLAAYEHVERELHTLRRWLTDSEGYATLADAGTPPGFTILDVAVISVQYLAADDPDRAVLDPAKLANLQARLGAMTPAERARLDAMLGKLNDPLARAIVLSAIASGATLEQAEFLATAVANLTTDELRNTFSLDTDQASGSGTTAYVNGTPIDQTDDTTCGSTSLVVLMAQSDPLLAIWLKTGQRPPGYDPPWLSHLTPAEWAAADYDTRLTLVEQAMKRATNEGQLLPGGSRYDWPGDVGTPPWGSADALDGYLTTTGTGYEPVMIDDQDPGLLRDTLTRAAAAANSGHPVPLYVGGDSSDGIDATIPRHVVLITGYHRGVYTIYEPSSGASYTVPEQELLDGGGPSLDALGNWTHPDWIVLPTGDPR
jgi:hypothetical protein